MITSLARQLVADLRPRDRLDRNCYLVGVLLLASGLAHIVVWLVAGGPWLGPVSYRKAVTFGLSFGLTGLTLTAVLVRLGVTSRTRARALPLFTAACVVEVVLVSMQAWRHVPSHFNRATPFDSTVSTVLAAGGGVIVLCSVLIFVDLIRSPTTASTASLLAARAGFACFLMALGVGAAMIVHGVSLQRQGHPGEAEHEAGSLKPAHASTMHAILVLPLIAWLHDRGAWSEAERVRLVRIAIGGYLVTAASVLVESIGGTDPLRPTSAAPLLSAVGVVVLAAVGVTALVGAVRATRDQPASVRR